MDSSSHHLAARGLNMVNSIIHLVSVLTPPTLVYVTDDNHRVSVYTRIGQFINCFGTKGRGEGDLNDPEEVYIAVDNTTGALCVCDSSNNHVVVY